jgi:hypothetical protein
MSRVIHVGWVIVLREEQRGSDGTISLTLFVNVSVLQQAACRNDRVGATRQRAAD